MLRSVARHSVNLAQAVVDSGALDALVSCLEEFDAPVKEEATIALGQIARHNLELGQAVVDAGAIPLLVLCLQEPELSLKRNAAFALSEIAKHSQEMAQTIVDAEAVHILAALAGHPDPKLKSKVCSCLAQISRHAVELAETVVESEVVPKLFNCLKDVDIVRKAAATCIREIARQSADLAKIIASGGAQTIVEYISDCKGPSRLPGIMTLGFIGAFDESLALTVIQAKCIDPLKDALVNEPEDHIKAAAAWSLGQIGGHSAEHAKELAEKDVLSRLLAVMMLDESSEDLKGKAKKALKSLVAICTYLPALEPLLQLSPPGVLKWVVQQFAKTLPNDVQARKRFVKSGGLKKIQELRAQSGTKLAE